ncbi:MAG: hypothetical protein U5M51_10915 [Emticicia sp.]|nr:hypothetical protein [Emticicia sp.]
MIKQNVSHSFYREIFLFKTSLGDLQSSFVVAGTPEAARSFINFTFDIIESKINLIFKHFYFTFNCENSGPRIIYVNHQ